MITATYDLQAKVLSSTGIQGQGTARNRWEVALSDGNTYVTWEPNLGNKAYGLVNQDGVTVRVTLKPSKDGRFQNYYLDDIAGPGETLPPQAMPAGAGTPVQQAAPMQQQVGQQAQQGGAPAAPPPQAPMGPKSRYTPEEEARMARSAALKYATHLASGVFAGIGPESTPQVDEYIRAKTEEYLAFTQTGLWDPAQAVVAQVNAVAGEGAVQQGATVPWDNQAEAPVAS